MVTRLSGNDTAPDADRETRDVREARETREVVNEATTHLRFIACGNSARQDDGAGPLLLDRLTTQYGNATQADDGTTYHISYIETFQLNPENAYDLIDQDIVIFIDARIRKSMPAESGVLLEPITADAQCQFSSHQQTPAAILALYNKVTEQPLPACYLLSIGGDGFELGQPMSALCGAHIETALKMLNASLFTHHLEDHTPRLSDSGLGDNSNTHSNLNTQARRHA